MMTKNTANFVFLFLFIYLLLTHSLRVTGCSKTIDNIFYNKPMLNIIAGMKQALVYQIFWWSNFWLNHLQLMQNLDKHVNYKDARRTLIRQNLKMTYTKSAGKNTSNPDSNAVLEHFLQIINKLLDKHVR